MSDIRAFLNKMKPYDLGRVSLGCRTLYKCLEELFWWHSVETGGGGGDKTQSTAGEEQQAGVNWVLYLISLRRRGVGWRVLISVNFGLVSPCSR